MHLLSVSVSGCKDDKSCHVARSCTRYHGLVALTSVLLAAYFTPALLRQQASLALGTHGAVLTVVVMVVVSVVFVSHALFVRAENRALLSALREELVGRTVAFSGVSETAAARLLRDAKLQLVDGEDGELRTVRLQVAAFAWGSLSEADGTPQALAHLRAALGSLGVHFGPGGYALLDMHARQSIYALRVENTVFTGGADALIVPHGIAPLSAPSEARVVVELKKLRKPLGDSALGQSLTELLASNGASSHPCLVLLTDGTTCDVLRLTAGTVTRWAGRSLAEAATYVADYLLHECTSARRFAPEEVPCFTSELGSTRARLAELTDCSGGPGCDG